MIILYINFYLKFILQIKIIVFTQIFKNKNKIYIYYNKKLMFNSLNKKLRFNNL